MPRWNYRIELNKVIGAMNEKYDLSRLEEDCPVEVKEAVAAEVEKASPLVHLANDLRAAKSIAALNRELERVYDCADVGRVWCGMF